MKPGKNDRRHSILITGAELDELKRHTWAMAEAFGLNRRIEEYNGSRPITLYRWDIECLLDVMDVQLRDEEDYPDKESEEYMALKSLYDRIRKEYEDAYGAL